MEATASGKVGIVKSDEVVGQGQEGCSRGEGNTVRMCVVLLFGGRRSAAAIAEWVEMCSSAAGVSASGAGYCT